jgi:hypothetical protein
MFKMNVVKDQDAEGIIEKHRKKPIPDNYHQRRKHIKSLIDKSDVKLVDWVRESGRPKRTQYQYVWQVLDGREGKVSVNVLDDLEHVLKYFGYWEPMDNSQNDNNN